MVAGGPRQSAVTENTRAETLGPDGGQQTWKPGPGGAEGPTDAKESTHILFPLSMPTPGEGTGAGGGGPRSMGAAVGRPGARARHAARPVPGTAAGGRAIRGSVSTIAQHGTPTDNTGTRLVGGQDNGELSDVAQKYGTTREIDPFRKISCGIGIRFFNLYDKESGNTLGTPGRLGPERLSRSTDCVTG